MEAHYHDTDGVSEYSLCLAEGLDLQVELQAEVDGGQSNTERTFLADGKLIFMHNNS